MSTFTRKLTRSTAVAFGAAALIAAVAACSNSAGHDMNTTSASPTVSTENGAGANAQDVAFAQMMIPHHQQAVQMAQMVPSHTQNQTLRTLASQIEAAQEPEIQTMNQWLTQWEASPAPTPGDHSSHGSGMMTAQQMADLDKAQGAEFERMWLEMMIQHHEGAVTMAQQEIATGSNQDAKAMAQAIIDGQTKEINEMNKMLGVAASMNAAHGDHMNP